MEKTSQNYSCMDSLVFR